MTKPQKIEGGKEIVKKMSFEEKRTYFWGRYIFEVESKTEGIANIVKNLANCTTPAEFTTAIYMKSIDRYDVDYIEAWMYVTFFEEPELTKTDKKRLKNLLNDIPSYGK